MITFDKYKSDRNEYISECPLGFIDEFASLSYNKYSEAKLKKELNLAPTEVSKIAFESFKVIAAAEGNIMDYEMDKQEKESKKNAPRSKR